MLLLFVVFGYHEQRGTDSEMVLYLCISERGLDLFRSGRCTVERESV